MLTREQRLERLGRLSTRELLLWLERSRRYGGRYSPDETNYYEAGEVKAVLAGRPHVPNKAEGEARRRAAAGGRKQARNRRHHRGHRHA